MMKSSEDREETNLPMRITQEIRKNKCFAIALGCLTVSILHLVLFITFDTQPLTAISAFFSDFLIPGFLIRLLTILNRPKEINLQLIIESFVVSILANIVIMLIVLYLNIDPVFAPISTFILSCFLSILVIAKRPEVYLDRSDISLISGAFIIFIVATILLFSAPRQFGIDETSNMTWAKYALDNKQVFPIGVSGDRLDLAYYLLGRYTWIILSAYYLETTSLLQSNLPLMSAMFLPMISLVGSLFVKSFYVKDKLIKLVPFVIIVSNPLIIFLSGQALNDLALGFFLVYGSYVLIGSFSSHNAKPNLNLSQFIASLSIIFFAYTIKPHLAVALSIVIMILFYLLKFKRTRRNMIVLLLLSSPLIVYEAFIDIPYVNAVWFHGNPISPNVAKLVFISPLENIVSLFASSSFDSQTLLSFSADQLLKYFYRLLSPEAIGLSVCCSLPVLAYLSLEKKSIRTKMLVIFGLANLIVLYVFFLSTATFHDISRYSVYIVPILAVMLAISIRTIFKRPSGFSIITVIVACFIILMIGLYLMSKYESIEVGYALQTQEHLYYYLTIPGFIAIMIAFAPLIKQKIWSSDRSAIKAQYNIKYYVFAIIVILSSIVGANVYFISFVNSESILMKDHEYQSITSELEKYGQDSKIILTNSYNNMRPYLSSTLFQKLAPLPLNDYDFRRYIPDLPNNTLILINGDSEINYEYANSYVNGYLEGNSLPLTDNQYQQSASFVTDINAVNPVGIHFNGNILGSTFSFNGIDDEIRIDDLSFNDTYAVEMLFSSENISPGDYGQALLMKRSGADAEFWSVLQKDGSISVHAKNQTNDFRYSLDSPAGYIQPNKWYKVMIIVDNNSAQLLVNGSLVAHSPVYGKNQQFHLMPALRNEVAKIGTDGVPGFERHFKGLVKYVRIYNNMSSTDAVLKSLDLPFGKVKLFHTISNVSLSRLESNVKINRVGTSSNASHVSLSVNAEAETPARIYLLVSTQRFSEVLTSDVQTGTNKLNWDFPYHDKGNRYGYYFNGGPLKLLIWDNAGRISYDGFLPQVELGREGQLVFSLIPLTTLFFILVPHKRSETSRSGSINLLAIVPSFFGSHGDSMNERQLISFLSKSANKVYVLTFVSIKQIFTSKRSELQIPLPQNIIMVRFPIWQSTSRGFTTFEFLVYSFIFSIIAFVLYCFSKMDFIYIRDSQLAYFLLHFKSLAERTAVKIPAFLDEYTKGANWALKAIQRVIEECVIARSGTVAVQTELFATELKRKYPNKPFNYVIVPAGVDTEGLAAVTSNVKVDPSKKRIGFLGYIAEWVGIDVLLRAVEIVKKTIPDVTLYIVGDGPGLADAKVLAKELKISTVFTGALRREDAMRSLKTFTVLVAPYLRNVRFATTNAVIPIKMLEGMALGVPVIVTRTDALSFLQDGEEIIFCDPDPNDVAEKIGLLISNPQLQDKISTKAKMAVNKFDYSILSKELISSLTNRVQK